MARSPRSFTEADVRIRPSRRNSRPRTKRRPDHSDASRAFVAAVDRGRYRVVTDEGVNVTAVKARELGRGAIVVGDWVDVVGDLSGRPDSLGRVVRVHDRDRVLRRSADDSDSFERIIVANVDQMLIVTALADPTPRPRMVDRCLVAAFDAGIEAALCLTKADLAEPSTFLAQYEGIELNAVATRREEGRLVGLAEVHELLRGKTSVLVGHSGVGKSTLVNALVPEADRATGHVNEVTGRGRHTSSSALALPLAEGGWIIDTPGVRSFGLAHVDADRFLGAFPDLAAIAAECPRGCSHMAEADDCALTIWSEHASPRERARLESFRRLLSSRLADSSS